MNKPSVIDIPPVESTETVSTNHSKTLNIKSIPNSEQVDSGIQEDNILDNSIMDNPDSSNGENDSNDEYEEIIFQDDFDKEYWEGTEDNYLEE